jgi:peptidoglycan/LPS O-acetylase OafA/YrhL
MNLTNVDEKSQNGERLPSLDGLRGWGAIFVVLFHVFCQGFPLTPESGSLLPRLLPFSGLYAVLVFFVVSGISLSYGYFRSRQVEVLIAAAGARYLRLAIPIFVVAFAVHLTMISGLSGSSTEKIPPFSNALNFQSTTENVIRFSFLDVFVNYDSKRTYAGPMWTMSIELIGSFILFAVLLIASRSAYYLQIILIGALAMMLSSNEVHRFYSLFLFGAVIAALIQKGYINRVSPSMFAALLTTGMLAPIFLPPGYDAWNMVATIALTLGCIGVKPVNRFLSSDLSILLGKISFPLYLVHGPVLVLVGEPLVRHVGQTVQARFAIDIGICVLSLLAALPMMSVNKLAMRISRFFGQSAVYGYKCTLTRLALRRS